MSWVNLSRQSFLNAAFYYVKEHGYVRNFIRWNLCYSGRIKSICMVVRNYLLLAWNSFMTITVIV